MSDDKRKKAGVSFDRRTFFKAAGTTAAATMASRADEVATELEELHKELRVGPQAQPIALRINGSTHKVNIEPRVTLLEVLRNRLGLTGTKEVCDRAQCGACTVLVDNEPVNACMMLAVTAQGREIRTIEGISAKGLNKIQKEFIEHDALMCGFCTPGFVTSLTHLFEVAPNATDEQIKQACSGHLCRCGTYPRVLEAARAAAGRKGQS